MLYNILVHAHAGLRWIVLILLLVAIVTAFRKWQGRDDYTTGDNKLYLWTLIAVHTQVLLGLVLYFLSPKVQFDPSYFSDKIYRFFTVEHITGMLIAAVLITIGRSRSRRMSGAIRKHKTVFIFFGIGLLIILASIPWPGRIPGATWF